MNSKVLVIGSQSNEFQKDIQHTLKEIGFDIIFVDRDNRLESYNVEQIAAVLALDTHIDLAKDMMLKDGVNIVLISQTEKLGELSRSRIFEETAPLAVVPLEKSATILRALPALIRNGNQKANQDWFTQNEISDFIHRLRHDIGNIIHNILGYATLLEDDYEPELLDRIKKLVYKTNEKLETYVEKADDGILVDQS